MEDQDKNNTNPPEDPTLSGGTSKDTDITPEPTTGSTAPEGGVGVYNTPPTAPVPAPAPTYTPTPNFAAAPGSFSTATETNAWAIVSLVSSILSWVGLFGLGGIVGVITGIIARNQIRESGGRQGGDGIAVAGIVLGGINIVLTCIGLLCVFAALAGMFTIPFWSMGDYR
jgi:hypothetical protein